MASSKEEVDGAQARGRMDVVAELESNALPAFREAQRVLTTQYPGFSFNAWSSSIGGRTTLQGHGIGLECTAPHAAEDEADSVSASIYVRYLTTAPELWQMTIEWGTGRHPGVNLELVDGPIPFVAETTAHVMALLPSLLRAFESTVQTWTPGPR